MDEEVEPAEVAPESALELANEDDNALIFVPPAPLPAICDGSAFEGEPY